MKGYAKLFLYLSLTIGAGSFLFMNTLHEKTQTITLQEKAQMEPAIKTHKKEKPVLENNFSDSKLSENSKIEDGVNYQRHHFISGLITGVGMALSALGVGTSFLGLFGAQKINDALNGVPPQQQTSEHMVEVFGEPGCDVANGPSYFIKEGDYPRVADIWTGERHDLKNDWISSIRTIYNEDKEAEKYNALLYIEVRLYEHTDFRGKEVIIRSEQKNLDDTIMGNRQVSSMKVRRVIKAPGLYLFEGTNFNGEGQYIGPGDYADMTMTRFKSRQAASLELVGNYLATLYKQVNFGGVETIYRTYIRDMSKNPLGVRTVSSVKVERVSYTTRPAGVYLYEMTGFNGKVVYLRKSGIYEKLPGLTNEEFASVEVIGNYEIKSYDNDIEGLQELEANNYYVKNDIGKNMKEITVKDRRNETKPKGET